MRDTAVFVFDDDPLPSVYPSLGHAEADVEAFMVTEGHVQAVYTLDGRIVRATATGSDLSLEVTGERDEADLRRRLRAWADRSDLAADPDDPVAVANELLRGEWEARWPRRPRWLARRLHGDGPPQV